MNQADSPLEDFPNISLYGYGFWFQWLIANAAGFTIGMAARQFLFGLGPWMTEPVVVGVIIGTALGVVQMFYLQQHLDKSGWWWALSNTVGWAVSWTVINQYVGFSILGLGITEFSAVRGATAGLLVGSIQWLILRQQVEQAGWWVLACGLGWAAGMAVGVTVGGVFGWPLIGAVGGAITGIPLVWLLRHPQPQRG